MRLCQEKASWTAGISDSGSPSRLPPGGARPCSLGAPAEFASVGSVDHGRQELPVPRHGSLGPKVGRAVARALEEGDWVERRGNLIPL